MTDHPSIREVSALRQEIEDFKATRDATDRRIRGLTLALRGMVDAHSEDCNDGSGSICSACAIALSELSGSRAAPSVPSGSDTDAVSLVADFYRWTQQEGSHGSDCPYGRDATVKERKEKGCTCGLWALEKRADVLLNGDRADPFPDPGPAPAASVAAPVSSETRAAPADECPRGGRHSWAGEVFDVNEDTRPTGQARCLRCGEWRDVPPAPSPRPQGDPDHERKP